MAVKNLVTVEALVVASSVASSVATPDELGGFVTGFWVAPAGDCAGTVWN